MARLSRNEGLAGILASGPKAQLGTQDADDIESAWEDTPAPIAIVVGPDGNGERLDKYLAQRLPDVSRSRVQKWIEGECVRLNGEPARTRAIVYDRDRIDVAPQADPQTGAWQPEKMDLPIVWEDEEIIVIDKPAGLVVHPGAGNWSGTLLNGLLAHDPHLAQVPRAGIVHRLDAGTSGLMVVARTVAAQVDLVRQLQERSVHREYWGVAAGSIAPAVTIDAAVARDPRNPLRFRTSKAASARAARTYVRRLAQWTTEGRANGDVDVPGGPVSWISCKLDTGRTHQIRIHLESVSHPLLGDPLYRKHMPANLQDRELLGRQALHAVRLALVHPGSRAAMAWDRLPPEDMLRLLRTLGASDEQMRRLAAQGAHGKSS